MHPIIPPPSTPGVYAIKNKTTGQVYVGKAVDLNRRFLKWRQVFSGTGDAKSKLLPPAIAASAPEDWVFVVLHNCAESELAHLEEQSIAYVRKTNPNGCLNTISGRQPSSLPWAHPSMVPKSTVVDETGQAMTRAEIAARCGVKPQAIKKRLQALRAKGVTTTTITELLS